MFTKSIVAVLSVLAVASGAIAKPVQVAREAPKELARRTSFPSFNNYGGFSNMNNFDSFFGEDNFDSFFNEQIIIEQSETIVCSSEEIFIVQQRLSILLEVAKQIIIEQICEVEVQTIIFEQFSSQFSVFGDSLSRSNGRQISYDSNISNLFGSVFSGEGSLSNNDLGFSGSDVGNHSVLVGGNNWNDESSPESVGNAKNLALEASNSTKSNNETESSD